ncbi:M23 family metallopeptidase [Xanthomonas sp. NCPPB 2654]|uniref:M23 family metallopeptidase n=1 Tax=unclassified Xanthomonas TaxID=2643310 RepID=UPI0021E0C436|nr:MULTISPECIES: M23 family metallopeptidase [unclassified Xanthomonas]MDL5365070.1 M23 family metallopeptidase [Xanthomonas sp. NCPPB 2654]UYC19534.1 M23 family metallopeptidase [Xanthomonas sp. CFBP 8443]
MPGQCQAPATAREASAFPQRRRAAPRWRLCIAWSLLAAVPGLGAAATLYAWKDADGVAHYGDHVADPQREAASGPPPPTRPSAAQTALARLRLDGQAPRQQAWADNRLDGPVQVHLRYRHVDNVAAVPALPLRTVLPARGSALLSRLYASDPRYASQFDLVLEAVPGDPAAKPQDALYRLPFDGVPVRVDQGVGGRFSHHDAQNYYALDFALAEGTPVLAARAGTVMQVETGFAEAGLDRETFGGRANFVRIVHADGSMALYAHLAPQGVAVHAGQRVAAGERLALSGNTGLSTAPHLHFAVQANRGMRLESIPFRMAGALGELKLPRSEEAAQPVAGAAAL